MDISLADIWRAWRNFRKGKKQSRAILEFEHDLEINLRQLHNEIVSRTYKHGGYRRMIVEESKRREIAVAEVRDRVVHRLLYDYLILRFNASFDYDVVLSRRQRLNGCY